MSCLLKHLIELSCAHCLCPNMLLTLLPQTKPAEACEQKWLIFIVFFECGIQVSWLKFLPSISNALIENKPRFLSQTKYARVKKIKSHSDNVRAGGSAAYTSFCSTMIAVCQQAASNLLKYLLGCFHTAV